MTNPQRNPGGKTGRPNDRGPRHGRPPGPRPSARSGSESNPLGELGLSKDAPLGDRARHAVCRVLSRQCRLWPEFDLSAMDRVLDAEAAELSDLDRAFAFAIYDAAVRNWLALSFLLGRCTNQPLEDLEPRLRGVLIAAAAQVLLLDKVPPHAAVNHAVEWAKKVIRPGAGAMANAVLRKFMALCPPEGSPRKREKYTDRRDELPTPDGGSIVLGSEILPDIEIERLAIATSHPRELINHWLKSRPLREVRFLAMHGVCQAPTVINTAYLTSPLPTLPDGVTLTAHSVDGHHVFTGSTPQLRTLLHARKDLWVQDSASTHAVHSVADLKPSLILDLCAGQGTKTRQLAAAFPNAKIAATDIDQDRFSTLQSSFAKSEQVEVLAPRRLREKYLMGETKADLILLDVPCSNSGVLARRPEARYRFSAEKLKELVSVQKQIIADAIPLLRNALTPSSGKILYSTCSLEPEENYQQAAWCDKWHKVGVSRERSLMPTGQPGDPATKYGDGAFAALLG